MLREWLEFYLHQLSAEGVTEFFLRFILVVWGAAILFLPFRFGRASSFISYAPTLLTSLGILGTFVGIVVGLLDFNPHEIDASIDQLLGGLKTAFITSIAGVSAAIAFKIVASWIPSPSEERYDEVGPEDLLSELQNLRRALVGEEEASLVGQVKLLRSDLREQRQRFEAFAEELRRQLRDFAEMLSKSATEQVIEALRQVIVDFNRNLTEQFGENFEELNAAVARLVEWQEHDRQQQELSMRHPSETFPMTVKT